MEKNADRRVDNRAPLTLMLEWAREGQPAEQAETGDLSLGGCFVMTPTKVESGEQLKLWLQLLTGTWLHLTGEVTYQLGIGFGIEFVHLTEKSRGTLAQCLAEHYRALAQLLVGRR